MIAGVIVIVVIAAVLILTNAPGPYDSFARCVSASGAKMYGATWCPHCQDQKHMLGTSFRLINYVECSLGPSSDSGTTQACIQAGITEYPTWILGNGTRNEGEMTFQDLSVATGCPLNQS